MDNVGQAPRSASPVPRTRATRAPRDRPPRNRPSTRRGRRQPERASTARTRPTPQWTPLASQRTRRALRPTVTCDSAASRSITFCYALAQGVSRNDADRSTRVHVFCARPRDRPQEGERGHVHRPLAGYDRRRDRRLLAGKRNESEARSAIALRHQLRDSALPAPDETVRSSASRSLIGRAWSRLGPRLRRASCAAWLSRAASSPPIAPGPRTPTFRGVTARDPTARSRAAGLSGCPSARIRWSRR
jgi:hypothetical protein